MESELRQMLEEHRLNGLVVLHGAQPQRIVWQLLRRSRAFALAAQIEGDGGSDNLPTVIMEAMAAGLPVVSTKVAGIPEMVDDGVTGKLVPPGDLGAFVDALAFYLANPEKAQANGAEGKRRCIAKFDVRASAKRLAELLVHEAGVRAPDRAIETCPELKSRAGWWRRLFGG